MIVSVPTEDYPGEQRVALIPSEAGTLRSAGFEVHLQAGAGAAAGFSDTDYKTKGAVIVVDLPALLAEAELLLSVRGPRDVGALRSGQVLVGLLDPLGQPGRVRSFADAGVTAFALELLPRISRAQSMDVLSSMATIAGYKAVLLAAGTLGKLYPMMITAAGTITPARTLVVGAGVAGLQAIATSRRLGSVVRAYDIRPDVKEQVESLGATFLEVGLEDEGGEDAGGYARAMDDEFYRRQREAMTEAVRDSDVVITTAAVPGKPSPVLVTAAMVEAMRSGSVIVDLAAAGGGNCELTAPGATTEHHGVTILAPLNLPSTVPYHASQMFSRNAATFLKHLVVDGQLRPVDEDEIVRETLVARDGDVASARVRELLDSPAATASGERSRA